ncbi:M20 metallopeptidase family protein [Singulisphaera acidiphila]|uniref:Amidohydrolase n=1 Tax=Singulisphaera acidiphila (strain ATCC BAA-1392 / DSM 18658 / VKM B-2454 / MOB10) TaxID=886293 RepID=L0DK28_SINAD|nr:amidohydrolase [Singulisphaera acidiphila]AGA29744.1 amidohydrolase [Singulisphaera acidiphila DSM 18658]
MIDWREAIDDHIDAIAGSLLGIRRHLHAHPEPSREEFETTRYLGDQLRTAGLPSKILLEGRGIIAGSSLSAEGQAVAIRADMDALRIQDRKEVAYRSERAGLMHACGHDAHSTMVLGASFALHHCEKVLPWPVPWRAIFQPAEEVGEGALEMVSAGAIEGVRSIVALHVAPDLQVGRVALRRGVMTAFCQEFDVTVRGVGGHAARPHLTHDSIAASAQLVSAVYQLMPRSIDSRDPVVVSFGAIAGGTNSNVIPDRVHLRGTIRTLGRASAAKVRERLAQIARGVAEATLCFLDLSFGIETDAVVNDAHIADLCSQAAEEVVGIDQVEDIPLPSMGAEDFSGYLTRIPGCLLRLGVANGDRWPPLHSPDFDIDERALVLGAKLLARSAVLLAR